MNRRIIVASRLPIERKPSPCEVSVESIIMELWPCTFGILMKRAAVCCEGISVIVYI